MSELIKIAMVDDHTLFREAIARLVNESPRCKVTVQVDNGSQLIESITSSSLPDIVLLDINMKIMNGYQTAKWLKDRYPQVPILVLSMHYNDRTMFQMFQYDVKGFLSKNVTVSELTKAIESVIDNGFYYGPGTVRLLNILLSGDRNSPLAKRLSLTEREMEFWELACTPMGYKEISIKMGIPLKTMENHRDSLYTKLGVNSRTAVVLLATTCGLVSPDSFDQSGYAN